MRITKDFTLELRELYDVATKVEAYAESVKSKWWSSDKKVSNAIYAEKCAWQDFWKEVTKTFPDSKNYSASTRKDGSVYWDVPEVVETK
jgi:hypothetical protein